MTATLTFTPEQYLELLAAHNLALWPAQWLAYALALAALALAWLPRPWASRAVAGALALFWLAAGLGFHLAFFSRLTPAGLVMAGLFTLQGLLFLWEGVVSPRFTIAPQKDGFMATGAVFLLWALAGNPWLAAYLGHGWPRLGLVGLAPGATVAYTFGLLLWTRGRLPKHLLAVPVLGALMGFFLALDMGLREEVGLLAVGLASACLLLPRDMKLSDEPPLPW